MTSFSLHDIDRTESGSKNLKGGREKCKLQQILRVLKIPVFHRKLWHVDFSTEGEVW